VQVVIVARELSHAFDLQIVEEDLFDVTVGKQYLDE
jgi:hypothetical protein